MTVSELATVLAWHDALNTADLDTLVSLSTDDVEVADAHGAGQGHRALREWAATASAAGDAGRIYVHDGVVVLELVPRGAAQAGPTAAAFRVVDDHVTSVFHHVDLAAALAATELTEADRAD